MVRAYKVNKSIVIFALCLALTGCSTLQSKETFATCRAVDVVTTLTIVGKGGVELNPVMAPLVANPVLFVALNGLLVWWVWQEHDKMTPEQKTVVNAAGCIGAVHNTAVLIK